jgi:hypothetical protein
LFYNVNIIQVVAFIIDFAKERGLTSILNTVLSNPTIAEKFKVRSHSKLFSWNNYRYQYSVERDMAVEYDTSYIYSGNSFVPRSINFNMSLSAYGLTNNELDVKIRLEGLDEIIKDLIVEKLTPEQLIQKLSERPQQIIEILKNITNKVCFYFKN